MCKFYLNLLVGFLILTSISVFGQQQPLVLSQGSKKGHTISVKEKKAWRYYDSSGRVYVQETDINDLLCIGLEPAITTPPTTAARIAAANAIPDLQSFPGANGCILLDFDGHYLINTQWNGFINGAPIDAAPAVITDSQKLETYHIVSEDLRPFHLNITTSEAVFNTYPKGRRMRCVFTPTREWYPASSGGAAYISSFLWTDDSPCFIWNTTGKTPGEAGSHEVGHTLGLRHDGRTTPVEDYYYGHVNWAPIMGASYYRPIAQWSKGEYKNANRFEDDLAIMASHRLGYRADDHGNDLAGASALTVDAAGNINQTGTIERSGDVDMFYFTMNNTTIAGDFRVTINPAPQHPNLDIRASVLFSNGVVSLTSDPAGLAANIYLNMTNGLYYIAITGTGAGNPDSTGYSNYGSLGQYTITGTARALPATATPASDVASLYADTSYWGNTVNLSPGVYNAAQLAALGIADNTASSLTVKSGYELKAYLDDLFNGAVTNYTSNALQLGAQDNSFSSVVVGVSTALSAATVFRDCNYLGYGVNLLPGNYTQRQLYALGIQDNDLSSLTVKSGYRVVLFNGDDFQSTSRTFTSNAACLTANSFDNMTTSLRVEAIAPDIVKN